MLTSRRTLGLAATPTGITAVEVLTTRGRHRLLRQVALELPLAATAAGPSAGSGQAPSAGAGPAAAAGSALGAGGGGDDPVRLGKALKDLLRENHISASRCVIGLDAAYLAAKDKRLPPAAAANLSDILRLASEQDFASEGEGLLVDYVPAPDTKEVAALLVAAPRGVVERLCQAAEAAGLSVAGVTSTALALAGATAPPAGGSVGERLVLSLSEGGTELVVQSDGRPRLIRRLPASAAKGAGADAAGRQLAGELEGQLRLLLMAAAAEGRPAPAELVVWNGVGLAESALTALGERLGLPLRVARAPRDLPGLEGAAEAPPRALGAAALAVVQSAEALLPLDFLHSRLAVQKPKRFGRAARWGAAAVAVVLAGAAYIFWTWQSTQNQMNVLRDQLRKTDARVREANEVVSKYGFARGWYDRRPKYLDCLKELTQSFPEDGRIWATTVVLKDLPPTVVPGKPLPDPNVGVIHVTLTGKAADSSAVMEVMDRLNADPRLTEVSREYIRQVGAGSREVSFAINFRYRYTGAS